MILMTLIIVILLVMNVWLLQSIKDILEETKKQDNTKPKQFKFKREHTSVSKTNFRKHIKWSNRCIC